ncbi:MAG: TonB-dependent receptor [Gemmatimonadota bacterium]
MRYLHSTGFLLLLALMVGPVGLSAQEEGTVTGTVLGRFQDRVRPLPFALVEAWGPGFRRTVLADSVGRYRVSGLPAGALRMRASHAGHDPVILDVVVPSSGPVLVDMELRAHPVELPPLDVTADVRVPDPEGRGAQVGAEGRVEAAAMEIGSGAAETGLADAVRAITGNDPGQADDVLYMRGSTTDLKLVLLDGAPVYTPFHVAGLLRSFAPAVLGRADLHVGGAPARFDGGLTYILDLQTRSPREDRFRASGSLDLISATAAVDGPLTRSVGVVASARTLHRLGEAALGASPYGYRDVLAELEAEPAPGQRVRTMGFWNRESVVLDFPGMTQLAAGATPPDEAWWSNRAASLTYRGHGGGLLLSTTLAGSGYEATLPLRPAPTTGDPDPSVLLASARTTRLRGVAEAARPTGAGMARFGVSWEDTHTRYRATPLEQGASASSARSSSTRVGAYVDVTHALRPDLTLRAGLRADAFSDDDTPRLAPRASLTWEVSPGALFSVATGRYHQNARASDITVEESLGLDAGGSGGATVPLLPVATADHVVVSFDQTLGDAVRLGLSGFWKSYTGLSPQQSTPIRSSGVDLRVQRRGDRSTAWVGYDLSWYWSEADLSGGSSTFKGRQLLTAGLSGTLTSLLGAEMRVAYGAGLPYTSVPFHSTAPLADRADQDALNATGDVLDGTPPLPGGLDESFLRIDLELYAVFHPTWSGRSWEVRPYLRVLNALDRRDALFYAFQPWRSDALTPLADRPLVPVLGVAWRF